MHPITKNKPSSSSVRQTFNPDQTIINPVNHQDGPIIARASLPRHRATDHQSEVRSTAAAAAVTIHLVLQQDCLIIGEMMVKCLVNGGEIFGKWWCLFGLMMVNSLINDGEMVG